MIVLVVDDDDASRYLIASLLRGHGHEVIEASDGQEALKLGRSHPVDIVVTDILMPVMDGYTLARKWKSDPQLAKAPLLFYTASYTEPADRRFAESLGVDGFHVKPLEPEELLSIIEEAFQRHSVQHVTARAARERAETEVLREYSERLVNKLEQKVVEVDKANRDLTRALEVLSDEVEVKKTLIEKLTSDIVAREHIESALRSANETLSTLVSASPLAIVVTDRDWDVTVWNPAAERLLGWSADEAIGRFYAPIPADEQDGFKHDYGPIVRGEVETLERVVSRRRADGAMLDLWVHSAAMHGSDGGVSGVLSISRDVTEQRHLDAVKSDFVSMISHELRTPLTSIIGYSDLLAQIDLRDKPELFHRLLGKIRDRGDMMRTLIDDLLSVSQIQSGPMRLDLERTDIADYVRSVTEKAGISRHRSVVFRADDGLGAVFIDKSRLERVFAHVIDNAVKYSPDGGDVTVDVTQDGEFIRIAVTDLGVGIEPSDIAHVFDLFTQADMSDTRSFGGVGVGLYLARQTVEALNGRIEVDSTPGEGSTFTIILPIVA